MNIFYLSVDPKEAARMHVDKHVVKMILEAAQVLSTAHRVLDGKQMVVEKNGRKRKTWVHPTEKLNSILYKSTHINHPSTIWARTSEQNYLWLYELFYCLCNEYTHRYGKVHLTDIKLKSILLKIPKNIPAIPFTKMPQAMPDKYKHEDSVVAYRNYYMGEKASFAKWTNREVPSWWTL